MMRKQIDPVCGMEVEDLSGAVHFLHNNKTYYFCALSCKKQFERSPENYLLELETQLIQSILPP